MGERLKGALPREPPKGGRFTRLVSFGPVAHPHALGLGCTPAPPLRRALP